MRAPGYWWLAALVLIVLAGVVLAGRVLFPPAQVATGGPAWSSSPAVAAAARRETRPTLDPALFVGKARLAHQIAREIPDTLDQLYCYCECDKHMGHKSLLSCYTDGHAAT
ncbi:MAG: hypothetical protein A3I03_06425 [Candidatus Rokubacteria bacterium RIFCSPLOWO2_02_FULL_68_19]|jgi:hypothetical protein|nr:MAG: hypothetical protein A3I03_06425 [Candidatus Rokubacteria bacterium RIFCSPLOWO2_02_FULL_68_19]